MNSAERLEVAQVLYSSACRTQTKMCDAGGLVNPEGINKVVCETKDILEAEITDASNAEYPRCTPPTTQATQDSSH